ncbi:MAG TPA: Gfo/Idh/MocA family oxidoreductase [Sedimentisphaerales bacterium]|nr:Gfo/Idh/MocA family oxidoreductase [Sedimentisphaerales bacterium]HRS12902.1 Gfo/Idh/MocA family oxidoreductase [Sedimentisphaerales bacterium]HRV49496.1 Gfo/Idh/MocA family oxidoreductase [Sedimentisphaerales bacterium]
MALSDNDKSTVRKNVATAGVVATAASISQMAYAQGTGKIKVGLLGCGGRGNGALEQCLQADPGIEVIALADLFEGKVRSTRDNFMKKEQYQGRIKIDDDHLYWGYDCHEKLARCEADLLLMATAPAFRGRQMMAAIKAGKHIFTEKPVATDVAGCKEVMEASKLAREKGLAIVCGTQRRHELSRIELMKRIHDGAIGELVGGQCYWYGGGIWFRGASEGMSELDWQCENWYHFTWLSGDQICEQHIHNIDVLNWCFNGPPAKFMAVGGRQWRDANQDQVRTAKEVCRKFTGSEDGWEKYNGDIWDHIYAEFEYPNGARCLSFSGHSPGTGRNGEKIVGTKGTSDCNHNITGQNAWTYQGENVDGMLREHIDLIQSIRSGNVLNEGQRIAESTLTAIGARIAAYTGQVVTWDWLMNESKQSLVPSQADLMAGKPLYHAVATGCDPLV